MLPRPKPERCSNSRRDSGWWGMGITFRWAAIRRLPVIAVYAFLRVGQSGEMPWHHGDRQSPVQFRSRETGAAFRRGPTREEIFQRHVRYLCAFRSPSLFSGSRLLEKRTTLEKAGPSGYNLGSRGKEETKRSRSTAPVGARDLPGAGQLANPASMLGQVGPRRPRHRRSTFGVFHLILMCPCITTMNVQKSV
jgi:hypothetical protein